MHSVVCSIDSAIDYFMDRDVNLELDQNSFDTIITGGDASRIEQFSRHNMQTVPELVLKGILALSEAEDL